MLAVNQGNHTLRTLDTPTLPEVSWTERYDLQQLIVRNPRAFFGEIGEDLFVVGEEIPPSEEVSDRIDVLALDKEGQSVVIELKRGKNKLQLLQAISYAAMIAQWGPQDFQSLLGEDRFGELSEFLHVREEEINRKQRLLLVAESYDLEVLLGAEWLSERYGVDISCIRVCLATDPTTGGMYLACTTVFPAPELKEVADKRRTRSLGPPAPAKWEKVLAGLTNPDLADFVRSELARGTRALISGWTKYLRYRHGGRYRWDISLTRTDGRAWQAGRFEGDVAHWRKGLSEPGRVQPLADGRGLRFYLNTKADFDFLLESVTTRLRDVVWLAEADQLADADGVPSSDQDV